MNKSLLCFALTAVVVAASLVSTPGRAEIDYPWCSYSPAGQGSGPSCRFTTLEQCQATVFGLNGWCQRNARLVWQEQQQGQKRGARQ